jgi:hypothetical protein
MEPGARQPWIRGFLPYNQRVSRFPLCLNGSAATCFQPVPSHSTGISRTNPLSKRNTYQLPSLCVLLLFTPNQSESHPIQVKLTKKSRKIQPYQSVSHLIQVYQTIAPQKSVLPRPATPGPCLSPRVQHKITKRTHFKIFDLPENKGDYDVLVPKHRKNEPIFHIKPCAGGGSKVEARILLQIRVDELRLSSAGDRRSVTTLPRVPSKPVRPNLEHYE